MMKNNYPCQDTNIISKDKVVQEIPPSFNLNSFLYHIGVKLSVLFENMHGLKENQTEYIDILNHQLILFDTAVDYLLSKKY